MQREPSPSSRETAITMDGPLDFETEDPLFTAPLVNQKSRKKVIGIDDLLKDYYKDKSKLIERESKRAKALKNYNSDDDDNGKEALLSRKINECHKQMKDMSSDEEITTWGVQMFGDQKPPPSFAFPEVGSWPLLRSFMRDKVNKLVGLATENGEQFVQEMLVNGWLLRLVSKLGHVEESIAKWTYNLMLYSTQEKLRKSACDFWCAILSPQHQGLDRDDKSFARIEWFPSFTELKGALETYGFLFNCSSNLKPVNKDSSRGGPPGNIRSWIKFTSACFRARSKLSMLSASEAEELLEFVIYMNLDCQLQGLLLLLSECMQSAISCFTDEEWTTSCGKIARNLASRVPKDLNCLRAVECISGGGARSHRLRSVVAYQTLLACFDNKATDEEGILNLLISINVKGKSCNFFKMYIYLVLTENWLTSYPLLEDRPVIYEMWGVYLRNCSCQISSADLRPHASKVRTRASYLVNNNCKR